MARTSGVRDVGEKTAREPDWRRTREMVSERDL